MNRKDRMVSASVALWVMLTTPATSGSTYVVHWVGEMHKVMMGEDKGVVSLETIEREKNVYAIGPVEGLDGEITVFDGEPLITRIKDGRPVVERTFGVRAPLLIWTQVKKWARVPIPASVKTLEDLDTFAGVSARQKDLDMSAPFPFRVTARLQDGSMHVVNRKGRAVAPGHAGHQEIQFPIPLKDADVELIGFWSDRQQGVLTHMGSNVHVHGRTIVADGTKDGSLSGHVDEVTILSGDLWLPAPE